MVCPYSISAPNPPPRDQLSTHYDPALKASRGQVKTSVSSTACVHVNVGVACFTVLVNSSGNGGVCCVRASVCFACSHPVCTFLPVFSRYCSVCGLWRQWESHTHTHRYLSEMPSGGCLCFPDILHQRISSTVYKARLHGANKSNGESGRALGARSDLPAA